MKTFAADAILFDLDGVLVDSTASVGRQWARWAQEHGLDAAQVIHIAHGRRTVETVSLLAPHLDAVAETVRLEGWEIEDAGSTCVIDGAPELLASLPADRWAVATSGTRRLATARMHHAGLPVPLALVSADDVAQGKPHPEPYLRAAAALGVHPGACVVLEDAPSGIDAGHAAGARVIGIPTTYSVADLKQADIVLARLVDLSVSRKDGRLVLTCP